MKVWLDGEVLDRSQARVPVLDHGLLYGDGVFEGIRAIGRRVFRLADHLRRLETSARAIGLQLPLDRAGLQAVVLDTLRAENADDAYIRLIVTRGEGELGVDPGTCASPRLICIVDQVRLYPAAVLARGISLVTASVRRPAADALDPRVKSLNYLNNVLAKQEARSRGADEALLLNAAGLVAEASVANIFAVQQGGLVTPPPTDGALAGITRDSVLRLAAELGVAAVERSLGRFDLQGAEEVFLTGTGARIVPVASLDGQTLGTGERPLTQRLIMALDEYARRDAMGVPF